MRDTTVRASPCSYPQRSNAAWACSFETGRARDAGEHFTDWDAGTSKPDGFVFQLVPYHAPARIVGRFGHARFGEFGAGDIADIDAPGASGDGGRGFVRPVLTAVFDLGVDGLHTLLFTGSLGHSQFIFVLARQVLAAVCRAIGAGDLIGEAKVNADFRITKRVSAVFHFAVQVDVPTPTGVLGEAAELDSATNRARQPQSKTPFTKDNGIAFEPNRLIVKRYPAQCALAAAPGKANLAGASTPGDKFIANGLHGLAVKTQVSAASSREALKFKRREELSLSSPGKHRHFVQIVPNGMNRPGHANKIRSMLTIFDAILIGNNRHASHYTRRLMLRQSRLQAWSEAQAD